mgnify:CR=1 FL=1
MGGSPVARLMGIEKIAVLGAGLMGNGIAQVAACAGYSVVMIDIKQEYVEAGLTAIEKSLARLVAKERMTQTDADEALALVSVSTEKSAAADADLVVEAIPEIPELKFSTFAELDAICKPEAILASNTSSISINEIAAATKRPDKVIGMHFFNPPHKVRLLEIIRADQTSEQVVEAVREIGVRMNRELVIVNDSPGFASSRLGIALGMEAIRMVEQGVAVPEDIDAAMVHGYRHPIGPLRLGDLVGLDVRLAVGDYLCRELGEEQFRPPALLRQMVAEGKLGRKSGEGVYIWPDQA